MTQRRVWIVLAALIVVGAGSYWFATKRGESRRAADLAAAKAFYESKPIYLRPFPHTKPPFPVVDLRAETCGRCHQAIYQEWKLSTHAQAYKGDAQFMAELHKSTKPDRDVGWMCLNCHTPLVNQLERLVVGLRDGRLDRPIYVKNPTFDRELQKDAITCAVCHVRDGEVLGPYGNAATAPHRVRKAPELLRSELCLRCHQASANFPELTLACVFNTGKEHAASDYAKKDKRTCQSCHMPEAHRPLTNLGTPKRKTRRHWFGGSLIAKRPDLERELAPLKKVFPDGMTLRWVALPPSLRRGSKATLVAEVHNAEAGHRLPTGDPERFIKVWVAVRDGETDAVLASRELTIGSLYKWYPKIELVSDNRLAPKERRRLALSFVAPAKGKALTLELRASKHRINKKNFDYHKLQGRYVAGRVFVERRETLPLSAAP